MTKKPPTKTTKTTITGEITSIKFRSSEGWSVFTVKDSTTATNCTGTLAEMVEVGTEVTCTGVYESSAYGRQLKCESIVPAAPDVSTEAGVIKLLQRLPGIGPKKAMMAVQQFGHEEAWELACDDPEKIGVKPGDVEEAKQMASSLLESYEATVYLLGIGLTDYQAGMIYRRYGSETIKVVSENPFSLMDIEGFGFRTVFKIAIKAGIAPGCDAAVYACIKYVLNDGEKNSGNIWLSGWSLCDVVIETITETAVSMEVPMISLPSKDDVRRCCRFMASSGAIIIKKGRVFSKELYQAEERILNFMLI